MNRRPTLVRIEWVDPGADWPYFWLVRTLPGAWMELKGADYPDGSATHVGNVILAHRREMKLIEVME